MVLGQSTLALDALLDPQHAIKASASAWARQALADDDVAGRDLRCEFWAEGFGRIAERGVLGLNVPTRYGGAGAPLAELLLTLEGLGHGCADNGLTFAVGAQIFSTQNALVRFGDDAQRERYLTPLLRGARKGAFCMSEPDSGSDAFALGTTAQAEGDHYVLDGHKSWVTFAPVADFFVVFASTRPEAGQWGISAFLVDAGQPGVSVGANRPKMGFRTTPFGDVVFERCVVPAANRLGPAGAGASMFSAVLDDERAFLFAAELGAMERGIDEAVAYARQRRQFGRAIGEFQAVSHRIAEMALRWETARALLYKTALLAEAHRPITKLAALTKLHATQSAVSNAFDAMQVHGARGFVTEFEVERPMRDALGGLLTSGTSDIQKNIVARLLGL